MTPPPPKNHPDPEDLLEHATWLRRFARALALDEASADDLVQDAYGAAITTQRPIRDLRAFLGGAVRRGSAQLRRAEHRRRRREESVAQEREPTLPGAGEAAERVETMRIVLEELQLLPAAQRDALTLRFVDGLEPADIAARAGVAPATVRAHVARGLAALRERLDRRCGGRSSWTAAFAPWIGALVPEGAGIGAAAVEAGRSIAPTSGLGAAQTVGVALMSTKLIAATLIPLALLGLWFGLDRPRGTGVAQVTEPPEPNGLEDGGLADVSPTQAYQREALDHDPQSAQVESAASNATLADASPQAAPLHRIEGSVVDALTGEAVPSVQLVLQVVSSGALHAGSVLVQAPDDETHRSLGEQPTTDFVQRRLSAEHTKANSIEVRSDARGSFSTDDELPAGTLLVAKGDEPGEQTVMSRKTRHPFPFEGPIPIQVGPSFRFTTTLPAGLSPSDLRARFVDQRGVGNHQLETRLRAGDLPWARFPFSATQLQGDGPWAIEVSDEHGLWRAEATVARTIGIEPSPIPLDFHSHGALDITVTRSDGATTPILIVDLESLADGTARRVFLDRKEGQPARGRLRFLEPGTHRWKAGPESGEVEVLEGQLTSLLVDVSYRGATFDVEVRIDASAVTDEEIENSRFSVINVDDFTSAFPVAPQRDADDPAGSWRVVLEDLPEGTWSLVPITGFAPIRWEPTRVLLEVGKLPEVLVASPRSAEVPVRLTVRDAETGEVIPGAEAAWNTGGANYLMKTANQEGVVWSTGLPEDEESHALVRAPGYRMACARVVPIDDGQRIEVELERGWRGLVRVMRTDDFSLVPDVEVEVDGASAGRTDENGLLWIDGDAPPTLIELADNAPTVVLSPFDPPGLLPSDPLTGWTFLVRRR